MRFPPAWLAMVTLGLMGWAAAVAQPAPPAAWSTLRSGNPAGMEFSLRLLDAHRYREGELVRAEVRLTGVPQQPLLEKWQFAGFLLAPAGDCGELASPCFRSMMQGFNQGDPVFRFGDTAEPLAISLNNYLPALKPGRYQAVALARKLVLTNRGPLSTTYGYPNPQQYAVSGAVVLEVEAASASWVNQTIGSSVAKLGGPPAGTSAGYEELTRAAEQLRFLDVPAAWKASLLLLPAGENVLLRGLGATREPARVVELMQAAIRSPGQAVSTQYISTLAQLSARANLPPPPPPQPQPSPEQKEYWRRNGEYQRDLIEKATAGLAASLTLKQGEAKSIAFQTLLERVQQVRAGLPRQPPPPWVPLMSAEFLRSYPKIEIQRQRQLLGLYAGTLPSPDTIPLLETAMDAWKPGSYYEAPREALRHLYAMDPARAQARIAAELTREKTWLDSADLDMLPVTAARMTDDTLIEAVAAAQRLGGWSVSLSMRALAKYATPKALPRIRAIYESQQNPCQPELLAYFVRVDPPYADQVFHSHAWDMHAAPPACTMQYFTRTPPIAMGPPLERYMTAYLMHGDVSVKKAAAQSLGRFGSPAALGPLWDAFRYFHEYWNGKQAELERNGEGPFFETELRNAIARGNHWFASEADLRTIAALCISERCRYETQQDLSGWQNPVRIAPNGPPGEFRGQVAQYYAIPSMEALEEKLAQFPKGTAFVIATSSDVTEGASARIRKFAEARGLTVVFP